MTDDTVPHGLYEAVKTFAGAQRIFEDQKHDLWRGDQPWKDEAESLANMLRAIRQYGDDRASTAESKLPSWINARDRVPAPYVEVLCYYERNGEPQMEVGQHGKEYGFMFSDDDGRSGAVTHWMPLPEPPK